MSGLFGSPKLPAMQEAPKPAMVDETRAADSERMRLARKRGRASTILAGDYASAAKTLLGQ